MKIVIAGATGLVGRTMIQVLEEKNIPCQIIPLASKRSAGQTIQFNGKDVVIQELCKETIKKANADYALFALSANLSAKYAPYTSQYCTVIDNSSNFRQDPDIPLVVPEVNAIQTYADAPIIANPNCSTIQSVVALAEIYRKFGLESVRYSTYQSVSGSGKQGVDDLNRGRLGEENQFYPEPIYNNVLPHIDDFTADGYTKEEHKMIQETRKILEDDAIKISATCVRVPTESSHGVDITFKTKKKASVDDIARVLEQAPSVIFYSEAAEYPTPLDSAGQDKVLVGRLRRDLAEDDCGFRMWVVADNIRKGAASNTVEILEKLLEYKSTKGL